MIIERFLFLSTKNSLFCFRIVKAGDCSPDHQVAVIHIEQYSTAVNEKGENPVLELRNSTAAYCTTFRVVYCQIRLRTIRLDAKSANVVVRNPCDKMDVWRLARVLSCRLSPRSSACGRALITASRIQSCGPTVRRGNVSLSYFSTRPKVTDSTALVYRSHGDPSQVVQ